MTFADGCESSNLVHLQADWALVQLSRRVLIWLVDAYFEAVGCTLFMEKHVWTSEKAEGSLVTRQLYVIPLWSVKGTFRLDVQLLLILWNLSGTPFHSFLIWRMSLIILIEIWGEDSISNHVISAVWRSKYWRRWGWCESKWLFALGWPHQLIYYNVSTTADLDSY